MMEGLPAATLTSPYEGYIVPLPCATRGSAGRSPKATCTSGGLRTATQHAMCGKAGGGGRSYK